MAKMEVMDRRHLPTKRTGRGGRHPSDESTAVVGLQRDLDTLSKLSAECFELPLQGLLRLGIGSTASAKVSARFSECDGLKVYVVRVSASRELVSVQQGRKRTFYPRFGNRPESHDVGEIHRHNKQRLKSDVGR